jgi:hypothetical protein
MRYYVVEQGGRIKIMNGKVPPKSHFVYHILLVTDSYVEARARKNVEDAVRKAQP